jgi:hypothetical protein
MEDDLGNFVLDERNITFIGRELFVGMGVIAEQIISEASTKIV